MFFLTLTKIFKKKLYSRFLAGLFCLSFMLISFFVLVSSANAVSEIHGAAWWGEDLEYLYFNCNDYETGSRFDSEGNLQDPPAPLGFHFFIGGCVIDHGVKIDANSNLYGSAWNPTKGFVNFGGSSTPVTLTEAQYNSFSSNCPKTCNSLNDCSACYNPIEQRIYGFAQVVTTGEIIQLHANLGSFNKENDLQLKNWDLSDSTNPSYFSVNPGDFVGHASSTINGEHKSLSFNCLSEYGMGSGGSCSEEGKEDYKVYLKYPEVARMTAPNWSYQQACTPGQARRAVLSWNLKAGTHTGYEVAVTKTDELNTSGSNAVCYSGIRSGPATQYTIPNTNDVICKTFNDLEYNTSYYWFVRLHYVDDGTPKASPWYQFGKDDSHLGSILDLNTNNPLEKTTFTTYKHEFPLPYFDWTPKEIGVGAATTIFNALDPGNKSRYYSEANPSSSPMSCDEGPGCQYLWSMDEADEGIISISDPENATTTIKFDEPGDRYISLRIEDPSGYYCVARTLITEINYGLPVWREVKAE